jgi:hypothetical protein
MKVAGVDMGTKKEIASKMLIIIEEDRRIRSYRDLDELFSAIAPEYASPLAPLRKRDDILGWEQTQDAKDFLESAHAILFDIKDYQRDVGEFPDDIAGKTIYEIQNSILMQRALRLGGVSITNNMATSQLHIQSVSKKVDFVVPYNIVGGDGGNPIAIKIDPSFSGFMKSFDKDMMSISCVNSGGLIEKEDLIGLHINRHVGREGLMEISNLVKRHEKVADDPAYDLF